MMTRRLSLLAVALLLLTTGCATMVNGRYQTITVDSYPSGAAVEVDCGDGPRAVAPTPTKIQVRRAAESCRLAFTRTGYEPEVIELTHQRSRATALNAAFGVPSALVLGVAGAIVGATVDGAETGLAIGAEAGYDLGSGGATAVDLKGGGWKWVPGKVFVILKRPDPEEDTDPE